MPDPTASAVPAAPAVPVPEGSREGEVALLGVVAAGVLAEFARLAADAAAAPGVRERAELTRMAAAVADLLPPVGRAADERSVDLAAEAAPVLRLLTDVDARTTGGDWWERCVKTYVTGGMVRDLHVALSEGVTEPVRSAVAGALEEGEHAAWVVAVARPVLDGDSQLAARLALWGRRVAGETLSLARTVLREQPALVPGARDDGGAGAESAENAVGALLGAMSGGHARRMGRLGLTA